VASQTSRAPDIHLQSVRLHSATLGQEVVAPSTPADRNARPAPIPAIRDPIHDAKLSNKSDRREQWHMRSTTQPTTQAQLQKSASAIVSNLAQNHSVALALKSKSVTVQTERLQQFIKAQTLVNTDLTTKGKGIFLVKLAVQQIALARFEVSHERQER
jgi:hypothetical protein